MAIGSQRGVASGPDRNFVLTLRLRERRRSLGLTQLQVVRRLAEFGVVTTNKALSGLERGAGIDVAKLPEFADALECTVTYLLGLTDDPDSWQPDGPLARPKQAPREASLGPRDDDVLLDRQVAVPVRRTAVAAVSGDPGPETTSWILGPYPVGAVPGDGSDHHTEG